jgi:hypothetical protein
VIFYNGIDDYFPLFRAAEIHRIYEARQPHHAAFDADMLEGANLSGEVSKSRDKEYLAVCFFGRQMRKRLSP